MSSAPKLIVVTATTNLLRALPCVRSWFALAQHPFALVLIGNGPGAIPDSASLNTWPLMLWTSPEYLGTVPAFRKGTEIALDLAAKIEGEIGAIACLHDDLEIHEPNWDQKVLRHFAHHPACGLLGFGGAIGLGADTIYSAPYDPMQLARIGFRSNLVDAETHGIRSLLPERVACLDGFSQVGRREFWEGTIRGKVQHYEQPWTLLNEYAVVHHAYDGMLGIAAWKQLWETWYLPVRATHYGGQTAVGDQGYARWAQSQHGGDHVLWEQAHRAFYEYGRGILPIRL